MKRKLSLGIVVVLSLGMLVGCTNNKTNQESEKSKTSVEEQAKTKYNFDNNEYLTDIDWLKENMNDKNLVIIDARDADSYAKGHIKGAINAAWQGFANMTGKTGDKNWGTLKNANDLSKAFSDLGIDNTKKVVVYATKGGWGEDGRLVWMFKETGINARMLNGGIDLWESSNNETTKDVPKITTTNFKVNEVKTDMVISSEDLNKNLGKVKILDSRAKEEYEGAQKFGEARGGHIKGAINLPFNEALNEDGTVKSKKDLEKIFTDLGLKKDDEIVTYCTAGIRSAHLALILKSVGYTNVKNYDASFYEWAANNQYPVEK